MPQASSGGGKTDQSQCTKAKVGGAIGGALVGGAGGAGTGLKLAAQWEGG